MTIIMRASAGTLESNDALVTVEPGQGALDIQVESIVLQQFGRQIRETTEAAAKALGVTDALIHINDKGAIACTLTARVETALKRAAEVKA